MNANQLSVDRPPWLSVIDARRRARAFDQANSLTLTGVWLLLIGLSIGLSGFRSFRPSIGGLLLHPDLILIGLAFPFVLLTRAGKYPLGPLIGGIVFVGMYTFASIGPATPYMDPISETIKVLSALMTIFTVGLLVRSRSDFVFARHGALRGRGGVGPSWFGRRDNRRSIYRCGE